MVTINFTNAGFEHMIDGFGKTISRIPVTKTEDPLTGEEYLSDGTPVNITGSFFRREDDWAQDKEGLFQNADAIVLVKDDVTINKNDKLSYDSENFRVHEVVPRRLGTIMFYKMARCFKI